MISDELVDKHQVVSGPFLKKKRLLLMVLSKPTWVNVPTDLKGVKNNVTEKKYIEICKKNKERLWR